jgi:hypothetical protein
MPTTLRIKRRANGGGSSAPSTLAASELAFNETVGSRILYYGLGNDGNGTATSVIAVGGPDYAFTATTNANLTGPITSVGNATSIASQTGTGTTFVMSVSPTLVTPVLGVATATSINKVVFTQPATSATLTIVDGATLTASATASVSGTNTGDNAVNTLYSSLVSNATHTGDATGSTALTVVRINGVSLAGLATGVLKNTTSTGQPSIAIAGTDYVAPGGALGTPSSGTLTNCTFPTLNQNTTGNAATVTTNANLTGVITSVGNATSIASQTGTGTKFVVDTSPTLVTPNIGAATGTSLVLSGNLTVNGTTTTLNSTTLDISDKNIVLGNVASPSEVTCDGGGITLKSVSDHTFNYVASTTSWTSSDNLSLASGKVLKVNGTTVLSATAIYGVDIDGGSF